MKKKLLLFVCCFMCMLGVGVQFNGTSGKAYSSQKQVKKELKFLKKKISKKKKEVAKAKSQYKKYKKLSRKTPGEIPIIFGRIVNSEPCVVWANGRYYYISNPGAGTAFFGTYTASVKKTGGTRTINGYTAVCVRVFVNPNDKKKNKAKRSYLKKQKQLLRYKKKQKNLKKALSFKIRNGASLEVGTTFNLKPKKTYYNKIKWKSLNPKIASVNSKGRVTAHKIGSTTIVATTNISKKTTKIPIKVTKRYIITAPTVKLDYGFEQEGPIRCLIDGYADRLGGGDNEDDYTDVYLKNGKIKTLTYEGDSCGIDYPAKGSFFSYYPYKEGTTTVYVTLTNGIKLSMVIIVEENVLVDSQNNKVNLGGYREQEIKCGKGGQRYHFTHDKITDISCDNPDFNIKWGEGYDPGEFEISTNVPKAYGGLLITTEKFGRHGYFYFRADNVRLNLSGLGYSNISEGDEIEYELSQPVDECDEEKLHNKFRIISDSLTENGEDLKVTSSNENVISIVNYEYGGDDYLYPNEYGVDWPTRYGYQYFDVKSEGEAEITVSLNVLTIKFKIIVKKTT